MANRVEHCAQTEQVTASIHGFAASLFGGHVERRAGDDSCASDTGVVDGSSEPEVGEHDFLDADLQQNIGGFHIAMNQSLSMSGREPIRGLHADAQNVDQFQRADSIQPLLQRFNTPRMA